MKKNHVNQLWMYQLKNWIFNLIISQEDLISITLIMLWRSIKNCKKMDKIHNLWSTLGSSMIKHSLSQESEDMILCNNIWIWSNTCKTTWIKISQMDNTLKISLLWQRMHKNLFMKSITMVNSQIQLILILKKK